MTNEELLKMDPSILLSVVNTKLRDFYDSLERYCDDENLTCNEVEQKLRSYGYIYDSELNQFRSANISKNV